MVLICKKVTVSEFCFYIYIYICFRTLPNLLKSPAFFWGRALGTSKDARALARFERTIFNRDTIVVGPMRLIQGGIGAIARRPIFTSRSPRFLPDEWFVLDGGLVRFFCRTWNCSELLELQVMVLIVCSLPYRNFLLLVHRSILLCVSPGRRELHEDLFRSSGARQSIRCDLLLSRSTHTGGQCDLLLGLYHHDYIHRRFAVHHATPILGGGNASCRWHLQICICILAERYARDDARDCFNGVGCVQL